MRYKMMSKRAAVSVKVPQLNGGVNLYDEPCAAADNQLTDCKNVWWHKGALRSRPGLHFVKNEHTYKRCQAISERVALVHEFEHIGTAADAKDTCFHAAELSHYGTKALGVGDKGYRLKSPAKGAMTGLGFSDQVNGDRRWYYLLSNGDMLQSDGDGWSKAEPYIPTVLMNGQGFVTLGDAFESSVNGDVYEDYNLLTRAYRCQYTTDGKSAVWKLPFAMGAAEDGETLVKLELVLNNEGNELRLAVDLTKQKKSHKFDVSTSAVGLESADWGDNAELVVNVDTEKAHVTTRLIATGNNPGEQPGTNIPRSVSNNLSITAWRPEDHDHRETICRMTQCVWYGGTSSGLAGGTRLFVCGHPTEPNLMHWSELNQPLYFPENNRARVGDASQALTGFGKQGELLVLFKEHQTYATQYAEGTDADYEFALTGNMPTNTYAAKFPIIPINDSVGCDCPNTIRLVNNRLVWANTNGHVYLLTGVNQFSERNVRDISRNITPRLQIHTEELATAVAGEYEGYYLLAVGNTIYLLDTQNSAFSSFNYYSNEDAARKALPWYVWTLPPTAGNVVGMVADGERVCIVTDAGEYVLDGDTDDGARITGHFSTKQFDFGLPDRTKSVGQVYIGMQMDPAARMHLTYITEKGNRRDPYTLEGDTFAVLGNQGYLRQMRVTPYIRLVQSFGIRADFCGTLAVDGIMMKVTQQGVVR